MDSIVDEYQADLPALNTEFLAISVQIPLSMFAIVPSLSDDEIWTLLSAIAADGAMTDGSEKARLLGKLEALVRSFMDRRRPSEASRGLWQQIPSTWDAHK